VLLCGYNEAYENPSDPASVARLHRRDCGPGKGEQDPAERGGPGQGQPVRQVRRGGFQSREPRD